MGFEEIAKINDRIVEDRNSRTESQSLSKFKLIP